MEKKKITVYGNLAAEMSSLCGGACAQCGSSCGDAAEKKSRSLSELLADLHSNYGAIYDIEMVNVPDEDEKEITELFNSVLVATHEKLALSEATYEIVMPFILPLILHNKSVVSVGGVPTAVELDNAIAHCSIVDMTVS